MGKCVLAQLILIPWAPSLLGANNVGCMKSSAAEEDKQHEKLSAKVKSNLSALSPTTKRDMPLRRVQRLKNQHMIFWESKSGGAQTAGGLAI
jgi:hypothetical protein